MDKSKLIDLVREKPAIWDQRDKRYHNREVRAMLWNEISQKMQIPADQIKKSWELLRDTFRRELRKYKDPKSGRGVDDDYIEANCKWPYFQPMLFLKDILQPRKTATNIPSSCTQQALLEIDSNNDNASSLEDPENNLSDLETTENIPEIVDDKNNSEPNEKPKTSSAKKNKFQEEALMIEKKKIKLFEQKLKLKSDMSSIKERNEDYHFFMSILPQMGKFSEIQKMKVKMEIMGIITREMEKLHGQLGTYSNESSNSSSRCSSRTTFSTHHPMEGGPNTSLDQFTGPVSSPHAETTSMVLLTQGENTDSDHGLTSTYQYEPQNPENFLTYLQ